jgi:heptaprenyl diphosphate synthase
LAAGLSEVEERLRGAVRHADRLADTASRHLVEAGGKRVRPMLTLLAAHLGDPGADEVLTAAVAVELTHLATLYHDDVMDSAAIRRGAPAAHEVWGNSVAIITGDLLFARASRLVSDLGPAAVRIQAETFERLCLGQLHETVGPQPDDDPVDHYLRVLADKTGSLIATSGRYGAIFGGCSDDVVAMLADYGEKVGVAFQLADDVIDLSADGRTSGKTPGTDLREGVATMPVLLARRAAAAGDQAAQAVLALVDGDLSDDEQLRRAVAAVRANGATEATRQLARSWSNQAVEAIADLPDGEVKQALVDFARAVSDRAA